MSDVTSDRLEIIELGHRFADAANRRDYDAFATLWTTDGVWHAGKPLDVRIPASAMREGVRHMLDQWDFFFQMPHAPVIDIYADRATSRWTVHELARPKGRTTGHTTIAMYFDRLERRAGRWLYSMRDSHFLYVDESPLAGTSAPPADRSRADRAWLAAGSLLLRERLVAQLSDVEAQRVARAEASSVEPGERYIDLRRPDEGVKEAGDGERISSEHVLPEARVERRTWTRLLHTLGKSGAPESSRSRR